MPSTSFRRAATAAAVAVAAVLAALPTSPAQAAEYNSIFPQGWDKSMRSRMFMRIGYVSTFTRTKAEDARDITGFVTSRADLDKAFDTGVQIGTACAAGTGVAADCLRYGDSGIVNLRDQQGNLTGVIDDSGSYYRLFQSVLNSVGFDADGVGGIGTPAGIKVRAQKQVGTPALSVGYWLDEERNWLIEGFVLAKPLSIKLYGEGKRPDGTPNSLNGKELVTTKMLPPLVIGSYNFGSPKWPVRPYVGLGVMYAVFFDAKTTAFFDEYQGGKTTVSTRSTFGAGPFVGLQSPITDDWHVNVSVGQIGLRTTSRLVTSNTTIKSGAAVLSDLTPGLVEAIQTGDAPDIASNLGAGNTGLTTLLTELVARNKGQANLGSFVREQKAKINTTIINISVGRSF